jgi:hypothetical protein
MQSGFQVIGVIVDIHNINKFTIGYCVLFHKK